MLVEPPARGIRIGGVTIAPGEARAIEIVIGDAASKGESDAAPDGGAVDQTTGGQRARRARPPVRGELTGSSGYRSLVQASTVPPPPVRTETGW